MPNNRNPAHRGLVCGGPLRVLPLGGINQEEPTGGTRGELHGGTPPLSSDAGQYTKRLKRRTAPTDRCSTKQRRPEGTNARWSRSRRTASAIPSVGLRSNRDGSRRMYWRAPNGIYEEWAFDRIPILDDALQDAGCGYGNILDHCRGPGPHVLDRRPRTRETVTDDQRINGRMIESRQR